MRDEIDTLHLADEERLDDVPPEAGSSNMTTFGNIYLGAPQKKCSFYDLQHMHVDDPAFQQFTNRFTKMLNELLRRSDSPVQLHDEISIAAENVVSYLFI
jgi:hypothetical protein